MRTATGRAVGGVASLVLGGAVVVLLPRLTGTTWATVTRTLSSTSCTELVVLLLVWVAGLLAYSFVLTGSLPGLSHRRALLLNLSGSAVSSALPLGGALGVWMNAAMFRVWGFTRRQTADFTVTSNVVDVTGKLLVCGALVSGAVAVGSLPRAAAAALSTVGAVLAVALVGVAVLATGRGARTATGAAAWLAVRCPRGWFTAVGAAAPAAASALQESWHEALVSTRGRVHAHLRDRWAPLSLGVVGYVALQGLLFILALRVAAPAAPAVAVLAAFAVDRLTSMVPLTPSGAGFAEAGATAVLVAAGGAPTDVLAGVLLYRTFIVALEVPLGGLVLTGWLLVRRATRNPVESPTAPTPGRSLQRAS